jgi:hypothetical protein
MKNMTRLRPIAVSLLLGIATACSKAPDEPPATRAPADAAVNPPARAPVAGETTILGPFTGHYAPLHPDNVAPIPIKYYGTDLGWTYEHGGKIHFLFGDTNATETDERIQASTGGLYDDAFGSIDLAEWPDPARISKDDIPRIRLGQNPGTDEASAINPGHAMESFKTPIGGFSNGEREFGVFYTHKPRACRNDGDCGQGLSCDTGLGAVGEAWNSDKGLTLACDDGSPGCNADPFLDEQGKPAPGSGLCVDSTSTIRSDTGPGRAASATVKHLIGIRSTEDPRNYTNVREWHTNKFANAAIRTVSSFDPAQAAQDHRPARGHGGRQRVFLWGRPGFIGVAAAGRPLGLYFAWTDLPAGPDFSWDLNYYAGAGADGAPRFSRNERDAVPLDLDSSQDGVQPGEVHDIVDQMSLSWVEPLGKWLMFYGGGLTNLPLPPALPACGVLELFTGPDCTRVVMGNGALRMRSADQPWGPWSPPQDLIVGGDPNRTPLEHQYAPGGVLFHPACQDPACVTQTRSREAAPGDYGFLYGANIIEEWTRPAGDGVDVIWNASTWDPYRVILLRTRIHRHAERLAPAAGR